MNMGSVYLLLAEAAADDRSTDIISLISRATKVGLGVLILLIVMTVVAVALIIVKWLQFRRAADENRRFLNVFWNEKSVDDAYAKSQGFDKSPIAAVFRAGAREFEKLGAAGRVKGGQVDPQGLESVERALFRSSGTELGALETFLPILAIMASSGPFIGLFGTVWGILVSFQNIASQGDASLATVAPAIAEALVATAAGLFVAIPALIAYNLFAAKVKEQAVEIDGFSQDFLNIVERGSVDN